MLVKAASATEGGRPFKTAAALFMLPYFVAVFVVDDAELVLPSRYFEWAVLAVIAIYAVAQGVRPREFSRALWSFLVLLSIGALYLLLDVAGFASLLLPYTVVYYVIFGISILFGSFLFEPDVFVEVFYRMSITSALLALGAWIFSFATGVAVMVNARGGTGIAQYRLQGLLAEPSNWAPIVPAMILIAWRRRNWAVVSLAVAVAALSQSPTVVLVTVVGVASYALVVASWKPSKVPALLLAVVLLGGGGAFVLNADGTALLNSDHFMQRGAGRLVIGVQGALEGDSAAEARLKSTEIVLTEASAGENFEFGHGLNSASLYFEEIYPFPNVRANALWVRAVYEVGVFGCGVLLFLTALAMIRLARRPILASVFLPIIIASQVNSAHQLNKMVVLAILLFAFRWSDRDAQVPVRGEARLRYSAVTKAALGTSGGGHWVSPPAAKSIRSR